MRTVWQISWSILWCSESKIVLLSQVFVTLSPQYFFCSEKAHMNFIFHDFCIWCVHIMSIKFFKWKKVRATTFSRFCCGIARADIQTIQFNFKMNVACADWSLYFVDCWLVYRLTYSRWTLFYFMWHDLNKLAFKFSHLIVCLV